MDWSVFKEKKKKRRCSFLSNLVVIQCFFSSRSGLVGEWHLSNSLTCTFQTTFPIYLMFSSPTLKYSHLLEAEKHASLVPNAFISRRCSRKKKKKKKLREVVLLFRSKMCRQNALMHLLQFSPVSREV